MREIEFRAFDAARKEMLPSVDIEELVTKGALVANYKSFVENIRPYIMQYTGLLDKNGVKIFESDIVKIKNCWTNGVDKTSDMIGVVVFFECEFQVKDECDNYLSIARYREKNEVIGNKFENPELLGEDK